MGPRLRLSNSPLRAGLAALALAFVSAAPPLAIGIVAAGCKTDGAAAPAVAPPPRRETGLRPFGPAQYLYRSGGWLERTPAGTDHVLSSGRRLEIKGPKVVRGAKDEVELSGGALVPSWVKGPARYVFWKDRDVYVAATFLGDITKVATMPMEVQHGTFDWLDGVGLITAGATYVVVPGTAPDMKDTRVVGFAVPGAVEGLAADAKRAGVINVFGRSLLTTDAGKTFRDVYEEVGEVRDYQVRGNDLVLLTAAGRDQFVGPDGKLSESAVSPGARRGMPPPDLDDVLTELSSDEALYGISDSAIPLGDGVLLFVDDDKLAKIEAGTGRVIAETTLDDVQSERCSPVRLPDAILLACRGSERAMVIDVTGVPKIERTFELGENEDGQIDGFSVADGLGIGFLGPCAGLPPLREDPDVVSGASQRNMSSQRSPVFCARASADHWIEHRLGPEEAEDVIGWAPRPGGDAVALIARSVRHIPDEERVSTAGGLRIVRIPRTEPPLSLSLYSHHGASEVSRDLRAGADGSLEAWLNSNNYGSSTAAVEIDAKGHSRIRPAPPRVNNVAADGPFALASSDDGRLFETVDWGKRWIEVKRPAIDEQLARPSSCSAAGCSIGPYVRVGWDSVDPKIPAAVTDYETARAAAREMREKYDYRRSPPKPTVVRLACSYASPSEGARNSDSYGFGFTSTAGPRMYGGANRMGWIGAFSLPWWQGPMPAGIDIELAWVEPFDLDGRVRRLQIPLARSGVTFQQRPYDARIGYVMDEDGRVDLVAAGPKETCLGPVLEDAGIVMKLGACLEDPVMGVRIKDRIVAGTARWGTFTITAVDLPSASGGAAAIGSAVRELRTVSTPSTLRGFSAGVGVRAGVPVGIVVDGRGEAVLAPIDPNDGYIGEVERLAPLTDVRVGTDPKCLAHEKLADGDARVLFPFDTAIGLAKSALPGVNATGSAGVAILRWSKEWVCLDAVEMNVRDERYDPDNTYEHPGTLRKVIARFVKAPPKRGVDPTAKATPKKKAAPATSVSASASASASAAASVPPWASPYGPPPPVTTPSASASAAPTSAPIPVSPPLPKGAGEGTLLLVQQGAEIRQKLFCTGTTP